jgi:Flp pilus assembly CpaF family ATPase
MGHDIRGKAISLAKNQPMPTPARNVRVTTIGGYLGAGKTTMLNALLTAIDSPLG